MTRDQAEQVLQDIANAAAVAFNDQGGEFPDRIRAARVAQLKSVLDLVTEYGYDEVEALKDSLDYSNSRDELHRHLAIEALKDAVGMPA